MAAAVCMASQDRYFLRKPPAVLHMTSIEWETYIVQLWVLEDNPPRNVLIVQGIGSYIIFILLIVQRGPTVLIRFASHVSSFMEPRKLLPKRHYIYSIQDTMAYKMLHSCSY